MVLPRIAGSVVGLLVVGVAVGVTLSLACLWHGRQQERYMVCCSSRPRHFERPSSGTVGAAVGATVTQRWLRRRSSFRRALLGQSLGWWSGCVRGTVWFSLLSALSGGRQSISTVVGLTASLATLTIALAAIVAGAVIGSGWKAKPRMPQVPQLEHLQPRSSLRGMHQDPS